MTRSCHFYLVCIIHVLILASDWPRVVTWLLIGYPNDLNLLGPPGAALHDADLCVIPVS